MWKLMSEGSDHARTSLSLGLNVATQYFTNYCKLKRSVRFSFTINVYSVLQSTLCRL